MLPNTRSDDPSPPLACSGSAMTQLIGIDTPVYESPYHLLPTDQPDYIQLLISVAGSIAADST